RKHCFPKDHFRKTYSHKYAHSNCNYG
ncbi:zinc-finger domain-containing protein, partial [Palaeococcus sp. (in: euryarchaeotes)]